jgi:hypothetical protein
MKPEDILTPVQLAERLQLGVSWVYEKSRVRGLRNPTPCLVCVVGVICGPTGLTCTRLQSGTNEQATTRAQGTRSEQRN